MKVVAFNGSARKGGSRRGLAMGGVAARAVRGEGAAPRKEGDKMTLLLVELTSLMLWVVIPIYAYRAAKKHGIASTRMRTAGWIVFFLSILVAGAQGQSLAVPQPISVAEWWGELFGFFLFVSVADALLLWSVAPRRASK
jgi:hypothetical protein